MSDQGNMLVPVDTSEFQMIELWLHGRPEKTQRAYRADVARFQRYVEKPLRLVTLVDLHGFIDSLESLSTASRARIISAIKSLLSFSQRVGYLVLNVGAAVKPPKVKMTLAARIMTEGEIARMLALEDNARNHALLHLMYNGGLRASEVAALCWRDLAENGESGQVTIFGKGDKTRVVLINAETWRELLDVRHESGDDAPVFLSRKGGAITPGQVWRVVKASAKKAGVKPGVSPHWLRHAHASHALDRGAPIHLVQATLGHASIQTTGRYAHARPKESSSTYLPL